MGPGRAARVAAVLRGRQGSGGRRWAGRAAYTYTVPRQHHRHRHISSVALKKYSTERFMRLSQLASYIVTRGGFPLQATPREGVPA